MRRMNETKLNYVEHCSNTRLHTKRPSMSNSVKWHPARKCKIYAWNQLQTKNAVFMLNFMFHWTILTPSHMLGPGLMHATQYNPYTNMTFFSLDFFFQTPKGNKHCNCMLLQNLRWLKSQKVKYKIKKNKTKHKSTLLTPFTIQITGLNTTFKSQIV